MGQHAGAPVSVVPLNDCRHGHSDKSLNAVEEQEAVLASGAKAQGCEVTFSSAELMSG